jgi:hypothetical protein
MKSIRVVILKCTKLVEWKVRRNFNNILYKTALLKTSLTIMSSVSDVMVFLVERPGLKLVKRSSSIHEKLEKLVTIQYPERRCRRRRRERRTVEEATIKTERI